MPTDLPVKFLFEAAVHEQPSHKQDVHLGEPIEILEDILYSRCRHTKGNSVFLQPAQEISIQMLSDMEKMWMYDALVCML